MKFKITLIMLNISFISCGVESTSQRNNDSWPINVHEKNEGDSFCSQSTVLDVKSGLKAKLDRYDLIAPDPILVGTVFKAIIRTYRIVDSYKNRNLCLSFKKRNDTVNLLIDVNARQNEGEPLCWPSPITDSLLCLDHKLHHIVLVWHSNPGNKLNRCEELHQTTKTIDEEFESLTISIEGEDRTFTTPDNLIPSKGDCQNPRDYSAQGLGTGGYIEAQFCQLEYCEGKLCETFRCSTIHNNIRRPLP